MDFQQYTIYMHNRPFKVAFLVDPEGDSKMLDLIIEFNRDKWGGRFNPIIFTNGNEIDDVWWANIRSYDPDIIYSIPQLSDDMRRKIKTFLSPLRIQQHHDGERFIHLRDSPISIKPSQTNLNMVDLGFARDPVTLCYFIVNADTPDDIREFLSDNFGVFREDELRYQNIQQFRDSISIRDYNIQTYEQLNTALLELGDWHNRFVYPSQYCSLPNSQKETDYSDAGERFEVVIGNGVSEKAYAWNRQLDVRHWLRTQIRQILITEEMVTNVTIRPGLTAFLNRHASQSNDHHRGVEFVSFSLDQATLEGIRDTVGNQVRWPKKVQAKTIHPLLNYQRGGRMINVGRGKDFHRANSNKEVITIPEPKIEEVGLGGGETWFVDLFIEYRPERFGHIIGSSYLWQLPRRNNILQHVGFFNREARINEHGTFSVLMRRSNQFSPDQNILEIKIPEDRSIFHALFCGEKFNNIEGGDAARFHSSPFYHMQRSDKGMYFSGVLSLFDNLSSAKGLFEQRFWRKLFERLSNSEPEKDAVVKEKVVKKLEKAVRRGLTITDEERIPWLADKVFTAAKELSADEIDMEYEEITELAMAETDEFNGQQEQHPIPFNENDYKERLTELVESNVLLMGVKPKCPYCGYRIWYHLDEVKTKIICNGCSHSYSVNAQEPWFYRANSLIKAAVSKHGTIPMLLALGELLFLPRSSSMFIPSQELLVKDGDDNLKVVREVDLICILDGKFVIGEVKTTNSGFSPTDFDDMIDLAKKVRPDVVVFSSLEREPGTNLNTHIERVRTELAPLEIEVRWVSPNYYAFAAHPVR